MEGVRHAHDAGPAEDDESEGDEEGGSRSPCRRAPALAAVVVGLALLIWVAVEVAIIGYSDEPPLQAIYLVLGAAITTVALGWLAEAGLPALHRPTAGQA